MLRRVLVTGPSMVPTLRHGDQVVVWLGAPVRPGDVVVARFPALPGRLVVKRAVAETAEGAWWVEGDNGLVADDSRRYGPAIPVGRVVLRYWPFVRRPR